MKRPFIILFYNIVVWLIFGGIYSFLIQHTDDFIATQNSKNTFSAFYFSATTQTLIGYGDITPNSNLAKSLVMIHILFVLIGNLFIQA